MIDWVILGSFGSLNEVWNHVLKLGIGKLKGGRTRVDSAWSLRYSA